MKQCVLFIIQNIYLLHLACNCFQNVGFNFKKPKKRKPLDGFPKSKRYFKERFFFENNLQS